MWLQWRAQTQIAQAHETAKASGMSLGLYLDLAVGPRPGGAEVWMNSATIAKGVTVGAPPDHLSPAGQSWALAAHAPGPLARAFYAPLRAMLRTLMTRCGILRIDHALGLLRSFWLPDDGSPGGYISQPLEAFLAVIAIEAERTGCIIVGEDLGLVPDGFRERLSASGLYSYSVWQYETHHDGTLQAPESLPANSLACFGTHDTPTLSGFWYGEDIDWWKNVGWLGDGDAKKRHSLRARQRQSLRELCNIAPMASSTDISRTVQSKLAGAPSALLAVQLDDALRLTDAQNLPGTIDEHPNWRRRLPLDIEALGQSEDLQTLNADLTQRTRR
jgi:4-alpha-glucanotransferase